MYITIESKTDAVSKGQSFPSTDFLTFDTASVLYLSGKADPLPIDDSVLFQVDFMVSLAWKYLETP